MCIHDVIFQMYVPINQSYLAVGYHGLKRMEEEFSQFEYLLHGKLCFDNNL